MKTKDLEASMLLGAERALESVAGKLRAKQSSATAYATLKNGQSIVVSTPESCMLGRFAADVEYARAHLRADYAAAVAAEDGEDADE